MAEYTHIFEKDSLIYIKLAELAAVIRTAGELEITFLDFPASAGDDVDTVAGALMVEDRRNVALFGQLAHDSIDDEGQSIEVTYNPLTAARETARKTTKATKTAKTPKK